MALALVVATATTVTITAPTAGAQGPDALDPDVFKEPDSSLRPGFTWWWPGAAVDDSELIAEVEQMSAAGFGNGQLFEVPNLAVPPTGNPPETYMWGTQHWADRIQTAIRAADQNNFRIDLQVSSGWPWSSPAVAGPNIALSTQELRYGELALVGPSEYDGPPPTPTNVAEEDRELVAVTAARLDPEGVDEDGKVLLELESTVDLTASVDGDGNVHWEVPEGEWILFGFWQVSTRATGFSEGNGVGYLLDHLNDESTHAATDYLDEHLFDRLDEIPEGSVGTVHEDSLEGFRARLFWTGAFLDEFEERRNYDLTRYLPALGAVRRSQRVYDFPGSSGERVWRDYAQTLTELWAENHVGVAREWANGHGLKFQGRAIGGDVIGINIVEIAKAYDVPDIDHISNGTIDWVRTTSSGAHLSGAPQVSSELGDLVNRDYMITLKELKRLGDRQLAGGVNALQLHGFPYQHVHGADWPSWWAWSSEYAPNLGISEGFGPELPGWRHLPRLADYFARAQTVLRVGKPVADVAIYRDAYGHTFRFDNGTGDREEPAINSALTRFGFTYDIVNPDTLAEPSTTFEDGKLVVQEPGYTAMVVDLDASTRIGVVDNSDAMSGEVAQRLLEFAQAGLPIVFVGRYPDRGVSLRDAQAEDEVVSDAVAELKALPNVRLAESPADVPAELAELDVDAELSYDGLDQSASPCGLGAECVYSVHRRTKRGDYWFIFNDSAEPVSFTGSFNVGTRAPERWDLWSGDRERIGLYERSGGRVEVPLKLASRETTVIGFKRSGGRHVTTTTAEDVVVRGGRTLLRSTQGGTADAVLSNGGQRTVRFGDLPEPVEPGQWSLHVEGAVREGEETHDLILTELEDWREIPELEDTSGTGTYSSSVDLGKDWTRAGRGAYLELGRFEGDVQVRVNGDLVHPTVTPSPRLDIGPFLRGGENQIEVELTTTLKNRLVEMAQSGVPGYSRFLFRPTTQPYGLIGPVRLVPYAERAVDGKPRLRVRGKPKVRKAKRT